MGGPIGKTTPVAATRTHYLTDLLAADFIAVSVGNIDTWLGLTTSFSRLTKSLRLLHKVTSRLLTLKPVGDFIFPLEKTFNDFVKRKG